MRMKSALKALLFLILLGTLIPIAAWLIGFAYWHVRITRAIGEWEKDATALHGWNRFWRQSGAPPGISEVLDQAGCRALPYLVQALGGSGTPVFKECVVDRFIQCLTGSSPRGKEALRFYDASFNAWSMGREETIAQREAKFLKVEAWWRDHHREFHQEWRLWSSSCHRWPDP